jgi:hypothetical protein
MTASASASAASSAISGGVGLGFGGVYHRGGVVGQAPVMGRLVPASVFRNAPRFHAGLRSDEIPSILQKGEEVVPRDEVARRRRQRLDGGSTVINNFNSINIPRGYQPREFRAMPEKIGAAVGRNFARIAQRH